VAKASLPTVQKAGLIVTAAKAGPGIHGASAINRKNNIINSAGTHITISSNVRKSIYKFLEDGTMDHSP
jgi:hypothetical protein